MKTIKIENETEWLAIEVARYLYSEKKDAYDVNWLDASLEFCIGAFKGKTKPSLRTNELLDFFNDLKRVYDTLKGSASFSSMESWLTLEIKPDKVGRFEVRGTIWDRLDNANKLEFVMFSELFYMKETLDGLERLLAEYPVK